MDEKEKDFLFYAEFVLATVMAFSTTEIWKILLNRYFDKYYPGRYTPLIITAVVMMLISIILLYLVFAEKGRKSGYVKDNENNIHNFVYF